jgi:hypothetical protein
MLPTDLAGMAQGRPATKCQQIAMRAYGKTESWDAVYRRNFGDDK